MKYFMLPLSNTHCFPLLFFQEIFISFISKSVMGRFWGMTERERELPSSVSIWDARTTVGGFAYDSIVPVSLIFPVL